MRVRFWGTRGSIPKPGQTTLRYGGNTSCVEVRTDDGTLVVLDCGTGAHALGRALPDLPGRGVSGHMLIGHLHWDHIQGFPFFQPFFESGNEWNVYAPGRRGEDLESLLSRQMSYDHHPVTLGSLQASIRFHDLSEGCFDVGSLRITTQYLNHPALALGFRLAADGAVLVYATDHEPHSLHPFEPTAGRLPLHHEDRRHVEFLERADLVIHDAQYALDEFPAKSGWGHCPVERAVDYAIAARVEQLALFHHDPDRSDADVDRLCELARERAATGAFVPGVLAAAEGQEIQLPMRTTVLRAPIEARHSALVTSAGKQEPSSVLIVEDDPDMAELLEAALAPEGVRCLRAADGEGALQVAIRTLPSLLLLDLNIPIRDGLEVCRTLRRHADRRLRNVPILILTGTRLGERDLVAAFEAGATDFLTKPIKPTLVRSRVGSWLRRYGPA